MGTRRIRRVRPARVISWGLLILVVLWSTGPIYIVLSSAFKLPKDIFSYPPSFWPHAPTLENFFTLFHDWPTFPHALGNSAIVALGTVLVTVTISLLAAFAFSRFRSRALRRGAVGMIAVRMFPPIIVSIPLFPMLNAIGLADTRITLIMLYSTFQVTMIPLFLFFTETLHWGNTFLPIIVPTFFANAFDIFLLRQFFRGIPEEMLDAARCDGASEFRVFWSIVLPLSKPVLATIAIFTFLWAWNDFLGPLLYLNSPEKFTLALGLQDYQGQRNVAWNQMMAASVVFAMPVMIAFFFAQRTFIEGIKLTGTKG